MKRMSFRLLLVVFALAALGGFAASQAWQSPTTASTPVGPGGTVVAALEQWLNLTPEQARQIRAIDPNYANERADLEAKLAAERERLAELFEDPTVPDDVLMAQVDAVIDAHDALERRVARYLLSIRPQLSDAQRRTLFERCAEDVREAGRWRWRRGRGGGAGGGPPWATEGSGSGEPGEGRGGGWQNGQRGRGGPPWSGDDQGRRGGGRGGRGGGAGRGNDDRPRNETP